MSFKKLFFHLFLIFLLVLNFETHFINRKKPEKIQFRIPEKRQIYKKLFQWPHYLLTTGMKSNYLELTIKDKNQPLSSQQLLSYFA